jgi:precorrin-8X/cobalt-precorrin-8 methylmutase
LGFSPESLTKGAAALASRTSILVDVPMIQVNIVPILQKTFGNPVYCCSTAVTRPQQRKTKAAWGLEALAKSHSEAIFVIGQDQTLLSTLVELYNRNAIQPALVIVTPPTFVEQNTKKWLNNSSIPHIYVNGSKGSATVAAAILNSLVELTWIAYQLQPQSIA